MIRKPGWVLARSSDDRVLHDDAICTNFHWPAFGDDDRSKENAAIFADAHVAANRCGGRDVGRGMNLWALALMFDDHFVAFTIELANCHGRKSARGGSRIPPESMYARADLREHP